VGIDWSGSVLISSQGNNYNSPVDQGDTYSGTIYNSAVGGRENRIRIINNTDKLEQGEDLDREEERSMTNNFVLLGHEKLSEREVELNDQIRQLEEKLVAKKEREHLERLQDLEDKAKQLEEELGKDEDAP